MLASSKEPAGGVRAQQQQRRPAAQADTVWRRRRSAGGARPRRHGRVSLWAWSWSSGSVGCGCRRARWIDVFSYSGRLVSNKLIPPLRPAGVRAVCRCGWRRAVRAGAMRPRHVARGLCHPHDPTVPRPSTQTHSTTRRPYPSTTMHLDRIHFFS